MEETDETNYFSKTYLRKYKPKEEEEEGESEEEAEEKAFEDMLKGLAHVQETLGQQITDIAAGIVLGNLSDGKDGS